MRRYWIGRDGADAADALLGIDGQRFSRVVQKHACRLAADTSFAHARDPLRELLGVTAAAETIRTLVERHGRAMAAFQSRDDAGDRVFAAAAGAVEFAVDAGKVNTREEGWKDRKIGVISKREAGAPRVPGEFDSQRLPAATAVLAFAMIATAATFRRSFRPRLKRLGVRASAAVHALGDGAQWIWKSFGATLPRGVQTLDLFHACEHVTKCVEAVFGDAAGTRRAAYERGRDLLVARGWAGVCEWAGELLAGDDAAERERRRPATEKLLGYFGAHAGRLNYAAMLAAGRAIGSGVVEGQAKTLGLRLKRRGARWNRKHVQPMASLVCVRHSVQWANYWDSSLAA